MSCACVLQSSSGTASSASRPRSCICVPMAPSTSRYSCPSRVRLKCSSLMVRPLKLLAMACSPLFSYHAYLPERARGAASSYACRTRSRLEKPDGRRDTLRRHEQETVGAAHRQTPRCAERSQQSGLHRERRIAVAWAETPVGAKPRLARFCDRLSFNAVRACFHERRGAGAVEKRISRARRLIAGNCTLGRHSRRAGEQHYADCAFHMLRHTRAVKAGGRPRKMHPRVFSIRHIALDGKRSPRVGGRKRFLALIRYRVEAGRKLAIELLVAIAQIPERLVTIESQTPLCRGAGKRPALRLPIEKAGEARNGFASSRHSVSPRCRRGRCRGGSSCRHEGRPRRVPQGRRAACKHTRCQPHEDLRGRPRSGRAV